MIKKLLIIIPAFNEAKNLPALFDSINESCQEYDIIVINDCSTDETAEICEKYSINHIDLSVNLGIGGAMQTGYKFAYLNDYDAAIQLDGDGQHNPFYINRLVGKLNDGVNLCIGTRFIDKGGFQSTGGRRAAIKFLSFLIKFFSGQIVTDPSSGFRACDRKTIMLFADDYPGDYPEPETIVRVKKHGLKIEEIPVDMYERKSGKSSITTIKSFYYIIKVSLAIIIASFTEPKGGMPYE